MSPFTRLSTTSEAWRSTTVSCLPILLLKNIRDLKSEQVLGQLASKVYGIDHAPYLERYALVASSGQPDSFETYFPPLDRYFCISVTSPKRGYFVTVFENITERKRSEDALQAAHEQFKGIIEFLPDATFVIDREGKVIAWNRAIEEMTGVPKEKMIGMGDYAYAVPFYGEPRPMLIDLVTKGIDGHSNLYDFIELHDKLLSAEVFTPNDLRRKRRIPMGNGITPF